MHRQRAGHQLRAVRARVRPVTVAPEHVVLFPIRVQWPVAVAGREGHAPAELTRLLDKSAVYVDKEAWVADVTRCGDAILARKRASEAKYALNQDYFF